MRVNVSTIFTTWLSYLYSGPSPKESDLEDTFSQWYCIKAGHEHNFSLVLILLYRAPQTINIALSFSFYILYHLRPNAIKYGGKKSCQNVSAVSPNCWILRFYTWYFCKRLFLWNILYKIPLYRDMTYGGKIDPP